MILCSSMPVVYEQLNEKLKERSHFMQLPTRPFSSLSPTPQANLYKPLDFLQVRAPLFPIEAYLEQQKPSVTPNSGLHLQNPLVQRSLVIGSIALLDELERQSSSPRDIARRERKLLRYLIRMSTRPTPYGLFAGVALAHWGDRTDLKIANGPRNLYARPDMGWLFPLIRKLESLPKIRRHLHYVTNTAAYVRRGRIFLLEQLSFGQLEQTQAVSIRATNTALHALSLARQPIAHDDLVNTLLAATPGATLSKVETLITTLWQHTLLFTDLRPPLTGDDPAQYFLQHLAQIPITISLSTLFQDFLHRLKEWNQIADEESVELYRVLLSKAQSIESEIDTLLYSEKPMQVRQIDKKEQIRPSSALLQVDTTFPLASNYMTSTIGEEVARAAELMIRISPRPEGFQYLKEYRTAFLNRYGLDREVQLLEVLDPQFGLGVPSFSKNNTQPQQESYPQRDQELLRLALVALRDRQTIFSLNEENLKQLETFSSDNATIPLSLDIYVWLAATSAQALDQGEYKIVIGPNVGANQAGRNLGRFASILGPEALQALKGVAQQEAELAPHALLAELVYLHENPRTANVALRPAVRSHEVLYGVMPGVESAQVIPLDELVLGVRDEHFYVRWPAQQIEVRFCAGHMLNVSRSPAIIRLLSNLSYDGTPMISNFQWGRCANFPFLPRIQVGNVVLSLAQWSITSSFHLGELCLTTPTQFQETLTRWRMHWQVPRYVYLCVGDNRLLLDLEHPNQSEELRSALRQLTDKQILLLQEALPGPEHAWLEGPEGHYFSEYVVSLIKNQPEILPEDISLPVLSPDEQTHMNRERLKTLGSEWLFIKLYCASTLQEDLIAGPLRTFVKEVFAQKLAEDWFFIRYKDPDPHIRLRFRGDPHILTSQLLPVLCAWATKLMTDGSCIKFVFDTYDREIERYGGLHNISTNEAIFSADSCAVIEFFHLKKAHMLQLDLQALSVLSTDDLLASLGLAPQERLQLYQNMISKSKEFGIVYRKRSSELRLLLSDTQYIQQIPGGMQIAEILTNRHTHISRLYQQSSEVTTQLLPHQRLEHMYGSLIHMHCNRLLGIDREAEQQTLELLLRTWTGLLQISKSPS